jgi:hypothetical protein
LNQHTLLQANQLLDAIMPQNAVHFTLIDSTKAVDVLSGNPIHYQMTPLKNVLLCNTFNCTEMSKRVQVTLTVDRLVLCSDENSLIFAPIDIKDVSIRTVHTDRELVGEYNIQFSILKQKTLTMKANSKEERNMWLGLDKNSSLKDKAVSSWLPLDDIVTKHDHRLIKHRKSRASLAPKPIRTQDIFTFYTDQTGEISPLESSDEEEEQSAPGWLILI